MSIKLSNNFDVRTWLPIDTRFLLSKAEMQNFNDNLMPDMYFTICKDDGKVYIYNKSQAYTPEYGRFTALDAEIQAKLVTLEAQIANCVNKSDYNTFVNLVNSQISALTTQVNALDADVDRIDAKLVTVENKIPTKTSMLTNDSGFITTEDIQANYYTKSQTDVKLSEKQGKLQAGTNITIDENNIISAANNGDYYAGENITIDIANRKISATDTIYDDTQVKASIAAVDAKFANYALVSETGKALEIEQDASAGSFIIKLKDKNGNVLSTQSVDFPIENFYKGVAFSGTTKKLTLTKQNGTEDSVDLSAMLDGYATESWVEAKNYSTVAETGNKLSVELNETTYELTIKLLDKNDNALSSKTVDLPIEQLVVSGRYDKTKKAIILILKNGTEIEVPVGDLVDGLVSQATFDLHANNTDIHITAAERTTWNNKSDFSGSYNDLTDKPTIPTKTSELTNDSGFLTEHQSLAAYRTSADQDIIDAGKQAVISDLETIRSNAALGATAVQPAALDNYYDKSNVDLKLSEKQAKLTVGTNITIENDVISAVDTKYTAGTNITIDENNVISAAGGGSGALSQALTTTQTVGGIPEGTTFAAGTSFETIFKQLLGGTAPVTGINIYYGLTDEIPTTNAAVEALTLDSAKTKDTLLESGYTWRNVTPDNQYFILAIPNNVGLACYDIKTNGYSAACQEDTAGNYYVYSVGIKSTGTYRVVYSFEEI